MKRKLKIALIVPDNRDEFRQYADPAPHFGAAPTALLEGFGRLADECEIHIVCVTQQPLSRPEKIGPNIFYHTEIVPKWGWLRGGYLGCIRSLRRQLKKIQPDIVHGQGTERYCALAAVFSGFPNVLTIHGNMRAIAELGRARTGSFHWLTARLEDFILPRTAGVFCNSSYTETMVRPRAKKIWRVPNALRREFFDASPADANRPCVLLNVGVITERKRQLELLDVVQTLHREGLRFEFHFIGAAKPEVAYVDAFFKKLEPLAAAGCARWIDNLPVAALMQHFDSASGFVHFPSEEAFGLVVAEAMARQLKFFGARTGGIVDIAANVNSAKLFEVHDWKSLTQAIGGWIKKGHPLATDGAAAMRERYHPEVIARRHLEIYREVLKH